MKNALIFTEENNLFVRKPNGLEYEFNNVDSPELGFDYDVLVYDDIEVKITDWNREVNFDEQDKIPLTDAEKEMCEQYIENSEPPMGTSLNNQVMNKLNQMVGNYLSVYNILDQVCAEVMATREDSLKDQEQYEQHIPRPTNLPDHKAR